jgi:hypothetical protein
MKICNHIYFRDVIHSFLFTYNEKYNKLKHKKHDVSGTAPVPVLMLGLRGINLRVSFAYLVELSKS